MQLSSEDQRNLLQGYITKTKKVVSALREEKLFTGMLLKESNDELSYAQNFLYGHCKLTLLVEGDHQVGKKTFLNVLLDDALIPSSGYNAIMIVQYDETRVVPALFTADLNEIFDYEKQVFITKQENIKETGVLGSSDIRATLKQASKINSLSESMNISSLRSGKKVFIIKYRIPWLKEVIADEFILNRIQFVNLDASSKNDHNAEDILRLNKVISSPDHGIIFVADGTKLFTIDTAAKYKELSANKERSLLIINRTDQMGSKDHLKKIHKSQSRLCSKVNMESIKSIEERIQDLEETEEMRREIFLQSFYDDQGIDQDRLIDGDVIYFVSALFEFNRILLCKYKDCKYDGEKADLCSLFDERNNNNPVCQNNKKRAARSNLDILQYYLKEEPDMYQNNFEPIKMAVSNLARKRFAKLIYDLFERVQQVRSKVLNYQSYLTEALSEQEIQELKALRIQIKDLFGERSKKITDLIDDFKKKIMDLLETLLNAVQEINIDFYSVKANHPKEMSRLTDQFEEKVIEAEGRFENDYEEIESVYKGKIDDLENINKTKKHMNYYITNAVRLEYKILKQEGQSLVQVIKDLSNWTHNIIITFINDGRESNKIRNMLRVFAKHLLKETTTSNFELRVNNSKSMFEEMTVILIRFHCDFEKKKKDEFQLHFTDYLSTGKGGSLERAKEIIEECEASE